jgi:hypothetical protein
MQSAAGLGRRTDLQHALAVQYGRRDSSAAYRGVVVDVRRLSSGRCGGMAGSGWLGEELESCGRGRQWTKIRTLSGCTWGGSQWRRDGGLWCSSGVEDG